MSVTRVMRGCGRLTTPPTTLPPHDCITVVCCPVAGGLCSEVQRHCEDSVMSAIIRAVLGCVLETAPWVLECGRHLFHTGGAEVSSQSQGTRAHYGTVGARSTHARRPFSASLESTQRQPWVPVHLRRASGENQTNFPKGKQNAGHQWQL